MAEEEGHVPAGWYPDPLGLPQLRWWDNHAWTEHTSDARQPMVAQETVTAKLAYADDDDFLSRDKDVKRPDLDSRLNHLHRVTTRKQQWNELNIFAFDHRKQLADMAAEAGVSDARIPDLKLLLQPVHYPFP